MKKIKIKEIAGEFCENKDIAKKIREEYILPSLAANEQVELDFEGVTGVTQSFIHAVIAEAIRQFPNTFYELVIFKNCPDLVKTIIEIVSEYMQESA
ncbi:STAS-like domain-containing protein [Candidatus Saccharibacteria bacterium]|nr:STAS-like domain-containing protein [Candidatus Saccharibacteria bacterium]